MTDIEAALNNIGETTTKHITALEHLKGLNENMKVAQRGGKVASSARKS